MSVYVTPQIFSYNLFQGDWIDHCVWYWVHAKSQYVSYVSEELRNFDFLWETSRLRFR